VSYSLKSNDEWWCFPYYYYYPPQAFSMVGNQKCLSLYPQQLLMEANYLYHLKSAFGNKISLHYHTCCFTANKLWVKKIKQSNQGSAPLNNSLELWAWSGEKIWTKLTTTPTKNEKWKNSLVPFPARKEVPERTKSGTEYRIYCWAITGNKSW